MVMVWVVLPPLHCCAAPYGSASFSLAAIYAPFSFYLLLWCYVSGMKDMCVIVLLWLCFTQEVDQEHEGLWARIPLLSAHFNLVFSLGLA